MNGWEKTRAIVARGWEILVAIVSGLGKAIGFAWNALRDNPLTRWVRGYYRRNRVSFYIWMMLLTLFVLFFWPYFVVHVHSGEAAVEWSRFRGGTVLDRIYHEGTHLINPFNQYIVYNIRKQTIHHEMKALTVNGLPVMIDLSIRYQPQQAFLPVLHQRIGQDYVNVIIIPEVEAVIRNVIGRFTPEELFTTQGGVLEKLVVGAFTAVGKNFITLDNVVVRKITLPASLTTAIEAKLTQEQLMLEYVFKLQREGQEAERKRIEASGIERYNRIVTASLSENLLRWEGVKATKELATSANSKVIVIGAGQGGLPIILNPDR
jgi:regulator of protease activity HflC (stomatin/prohibitin superfamily)